jgi:hypothetical protein
MLQRRDFLLVLASDFHEEPSVAFVFERTFRHAAAAHRTTLQKCSRPSMVLWINEGLTTLKVHSYSTKLFFSLFYLWTNSDQGTELTDEVKPCSSQLTYLSYSHSHGVRSCDKDHDAALQG